MLKIQEIREIIKLVDSSTLDEFVFEQDDTKLKLKKNNGTTVVTQSPVQAAAIAPAVEAPKAPVATPVVEAPTAPQTPKAEVAATENLHKITSPMVGTFYASPNPESPAFAQVGDKVGEESIVCIVEAMKLFNEIEAEVVGEIVEVLVENGELVEYGQPLFLVREA